MNKGSVHFVGRQLLFILLIALLALLLFVAGLLVGYSVVGDGKDALSILSPDKWQELIGKFTGK